ncbi:Rossmann-fold NAD(P)-binding domain-containing protein [Aureliella helgolandensis]|uniref:NAD dependent epimerase/dehydratase family protein n=1 Tax=Aureliella helgolandensis TaxID=2527968 RepID=A0A518G4L5_9BACT|nr:hypothetical protein [Aureliella helgolandensis]QDV23535.1 hypothetical protein Q31a_18360 [Aureliella helgolandensis]
MAARMLVLGGTNFIGRVFVERVLEQTTLEVTLLNRGVTAPDLFKTVPHLKCDRHDFNSCSTQLAGQHWNYLVDFSGHSHAHIENIVTNCRFDHYTYISSSAVELSWPEDQLFSMAQNKLWCEHLIQSACAEVLIFRPGYVVGRHDPTGRFEFRNGRWGWLGTEEPVQPVVEVEFLTNLMLVLILRGQTGIVRGGYARPRVEQRAHPPVSTEPDWAAVSPASTL